MEKEELLSKAKKLYLEEGFNCSESVLRALQVAGFDVPEPFLHSAVGLRAGLGGSGCICGALMAAVMISGYFSRGDRNKADQMAAQLHNKFRDKFKSVCCRVLTRKYDFKSRERKEFCAGLVEFMLSELLAVDIFKDSK